MKTLQQIREAIEKNPPLRKSIGKGRMHEACSACVMAVCDASKGSCRARQIKAELQRARYAKHRGRYRARARAYYRRNRETCRKRSADYQKDPAALECMAATRRARYAAKRAAEGKPVRPYRWANPDRNKGNKKAGN